MNDLIYPLLTSLKLNALEAFRHVIPKPEDRIALTGTPVTTWSQIFPLFPLIFLAYLARRSGTYYIRLAILPWVLYFLLRAAYGYARIGPQFKGYNWARSLIYMALLSRAIEFGLTPAGILKKGETKPGVYSAAYKPPLRSPTPNSPILRAPQCISDGIHLIQSWRGLNYQFSEGVYIPPPTRPQSPTSAFFVSTFFSFLANFIYFDLFVASMKEFFPLVSQRGGTIFDPTLPIYPIPWRYISSTVLTWITGHMIKAGLNMTYDFFTLFGVGLCGQQAEDWPPLMDDPFYSDSLHVWWGGRWHQGIRRPLVVLGGYPAQSVTTAVLSLFGVSVKTKKKSGDIAMLLGAFVVCGLYHECTAYSMGEGFRHWGWIVFALQGPLLIGERLWKKMTGRPVGGWWGMVWATSFGLVAPQMPMNSWYERGLGASIMVPPMISPTRWVIFPLARIILSWAGVEGVIDKLYFV